MPSAHGTSIKGASPSPGPFSGTGLLKTVPVCSAPPPASAVTLCSQSCSPQWFSLPECFPWLALTFSRWSHTGCSPSYPRASCHTCGTKPARGGWGPVPACRLFLSPDGAVGLCGALGSTFLSSVDVGGLCSWTAVLDETRGYAPNTGGPGGAASLLHTLSRGFMVAQEPAWEAAAR